MTDRLRPAALMVGVALALAACGGGSPDANSPGDVNGSAAVPSPASGEPVPPLEVEAFDGSTVSLQDYAGTPMVVNFWASWCPPCIAEMPDLEAIHQSAGDRLAFVGVNTQDTPEEAAEMVDQTGVTYDLVRDPDGSLGQGGCDPSSVCCPGPPWSSGSASGSSVSPCSPATSRS